MISMKIRPFPPGAGPCRESERRRTKAVSTDQGPAMRNNLATSADAAKCSFPIGVGETRSWQSRGGRCHPPSSHRWPGPRLNNSALRALARVLFTAAGEAREARGSAGCEWPRC